VSDWQAIALGLIQGATEFAPVSSSGHLILVPWLLGWPLAADDVGLNKAFDTALHLGTLVGALLYFRADVARYARAFAMTIRRRKIANVDERVAWALVVGTIPGVIVGASLEGVIQDRLGSPLLVASMLAVFGVALWWVDRSMPNDRDDTTIGVRTGAFLGLAQALALQPGVSRSGVTVMAARSIGIDRASAARFSFLLSLPIIAGAGFYQGAGLLATGLQGYGSQFALGFGASAISGFVVVWGLLAYLRSHGYAVFMWYRLAVAGLAMVLVVSGVRGMRI
jgi:undecaprenyl-diphosphatase